MFMSGLATSQYGGVGGSGLQNLHPVMETTSTKAYFTNINLTNRCLRLWGQFKKLEATEVDTHLQRIRTMVSKMPSIPITKIDIGTKCLARFPSDGDYYRASVIDTSHIIDDQPRVTVRFIDYGNDELINVSELRIADDSLMNFRPQAIECFVDGVLAEGNKWSEAAAAALNERVCYEELSYQLVGNIDSCSLIEIYFEDKSRCSDWLIKNRFAVRADSSLIISEMQSSKSFAEYLRFNAPVARATNTPTPPPPGFTPPVPVPSHMYSNVGAMGYGPLTVPPPHLQQHVLVPQATMQHYNQPVSYQNYASLQSNILPNMRLQAAVPPPSVQTMHYQAQPRLSVAAAPAEPSAFAPPPQVVIRQYKRRTLKKRSRYDLVICYIKDPEEFYVRLHESDQDLMELMIRMNEFYKSERRRELPNYTIGSPCIVLHKSEEESLWYRGLIKQITQKGVVIKFVDYGNDQVVTKHELAMIDDQFMSQELFAVQSCFHDMQPKGFWSDEEIRVFQSLVLNKQFKGVLIDVDEVCAWEFFDQGTKKSVTDLLREKLLSLTDSKEKRCDSATASAVVVQSTTPLVVARSTPPLVKKYNRLKTVDLLGKHKVVGVVYSQSPSQFWVQLEDMIQEFQTMSDDMNTFYNKNLGDDINVSDITIGTPCVACYNDDSMWYRAEIIKSPDPTSNFVNVLFVDYGNTDRIALQFIKNLALEFGKMPVQALRCRLRSLIPVHDNWSTQAITHMQYYYGKRCQASFIDLDANQTWEIELISLHNNTDFTNVANSFLEMNYAKRLGSSAGAELTSHNIVSGGLAITPATPVVDTQTGSGSARSNKPETFIEMDGLPPLLVPANANGFVDIVVSYIESIDKFYCQLQNEAHVIEKLSENLNNVYQTGTQKTLINPANGVLCVAKYSADNRWYRGVVMDRPTPSNVEVYFLDYGNTEQLSKTEIRFMVEEFTREAPQAFECRLKNVTPQAMNIAKFREVADGCQMTIRLEGKVGTAFEVTLFDKNPKNEDCNINDWLCGRSPILPTKMYPAPNAAVVANRSNMVNGVRENGEDGFGQRQERRDFGNRPPRQFDDNNEGGSRFGGSRGGVGGGNRRSFDDNADQGGGGFSGGGGRGGRGRFGGDDGGGGRGGGFGGGRGGRGGYGRRDDDEGGGGLGGGGPRGGFIGDDGGDGGRGGGRGGYGDRPPRGDRGGRGGGGRFGDRDDRGGRGGGFRGGRGGGRGGGGFGGSGGGGAGGGFGGSGGGGFGGSDSSSGFGGSSGGFGGSNGFGSSAPAPVVEVKPQVPVASPKIEVPKVEPVEISRFKIPEIPDADVEVIVAVATTPNKFYVQLNSQQDALATFQAKLNAYCKMAKKLDSRNVFLGIACAAKYSLDEQVYRCVPISMDESNVTVHFIDFGNSETVPRNQLLKLNADLLESPPFAIECRLKDVKPIGDATDYPDTCSSAMEALVVFDDGAKKYTCKFLSRFEPCFVDLKNEELTYADDLLSNKICEKGETPEFFAGPFKKLNFDDAKNGLFVVSYAESPEVMFVYPSHYQSALDQLAAQIGIDYASEGDTPCLNKEEIQIGTACVTRFLDDENWYRSEVIEIDGEQCTIQFIDYGNTQKVDVSALKRVKHAYGYLPALALSCKLDAVCAQINDTVIEKFTENVKIIEVDYIVKVVDAKLSPPIINLFVPGETMSVNAKLNIAISASSEQRVFSSLQAVPTTEAPPEPAQFVETVKEKLERLASVDDGSEMSSAIDRFKVPEIPDDDVEVVVSVAATPDKFYIQLNSQQDSLAALQAKLDTYSVTAKKLDPKNVFLGIACAAKYSLDEQVYRCVPISMDESNATVHFIDFGNSETVSRNQLFKLNADLLKSPPFAIECRLKDVKPIDDASDYPDHCSSAMEALVVVDDVPKKYTCKFLSRFEPCFVDLKNEELTYADDLLSNKICEKGETPEFFAGPFKKLNFDDAKNGLFVVSYAESPEVMFVYPSHYQSALDQLAAQIGIDYASEGDTPCLNKEEIQIGTACVTRFLDDENWYRSEVIEIDGEQCTIQFIDYGNTQKVDVSALKRVKHAYGYLPALALSCKLDAVCAQSNDAVIEKFNENVEIIEVDYIVEVVDAKLSPPTINLFVPGETKSVNEKLNTAISALSEQRDYGSSQAVPTTGTPSEPAQKEKLERSLVDDEMSAAIHRFKIPEIPDDDVDATPNKFNIQLNLQQDSLAALQAETENVEWIEEDKAQVNGLLLPETDVEAFPSETKSSEVEKGDKVTTDDIF